jgi:hypothetical protein
MVRALALASALLFAGTAEAYWQVPSYPELDRSRAAAEKYVDVRAALEDGYQPMFGCVTHGGHGAMGVHYIHAGRLNDGKLVLEEPEALMYEPQPDGSLQLVAIEYIVWEKDWPSRVPRRSWASVCAARPRSGTTRWSRSTRSMCGTGATTRWGCSATGTLR